MDGPVGDRRRYRALVETVGDPMYVLDADGTITMVNRAKVETLGYDDRGDVEGSHVSTFMPPPDVERGTEALLDLLEDEEAEWTIFEMTVIRADGRRLPMEDKVAVLTDDDGALAGSVGVLRDVSEREQREAELRGLYDRIQRLLAFTRELQDAGEATRVHDLCVEAAEGVLEFDSAVVTDGWFEIRATLPNSPLSAGDRRLRVDEGLAGRAYAEGESLVVDGREERGKPAEDSFRANITIPIGDRVVFQASSSEVGAYDAADLDLAELLVDHITAAFDRIDRRAELRSLTESVEPLHRAATTLQSVQTREEVFDWVVTAAEDILSFGWTVVAVAEEGWFELAAVSAEAPLEAGSRHLRVDEGVTGAVYRSGKSELIDRPDHHDESAPVVDSFVSNLTVPLGDVGVFQASAAASGSFEEQDRRLAELLSPHAGEALRRIDRERALREHERELRRQNERLERFASIVSHDLRNPFTVTRGYLEGIDHPDAAEIEQSLDRIETIVEDVLELARQGRTIDETGPVDLGAAARDAWENVATGPPASPSGRTRRSRPAGTASWSCWRTYSTTPSNTARPTS